MARIQRKAHDSSVVLYNHQKEAMSALNKADIGGEFSGIIVLPGVVEKLLQHPIG